MKKLKSKKVIKQRYYFPKHLVKIIMSYSRTSSKQTIVSTRSIQSAGILHPCKVCVDAKKPADVCFSHRVKDREGKVTCPTLLSIECQNCFKMGHTAKYCPRLLKSAKELLKEEARQENDRKNKLAAKALLRSTVPKNVFDTLYSSDEEGEVNEEPNDHNKPPKPVVRVRVKIVKPEKPPKPPKVYKKIDWATAESDSSGSDSESEYEEI